MRCVASVEAQRMTRHFMQRPAYFFTDEIVLQRVSRMPRGTAL